MRHVKNDHGQCLNPEKGPACEELKKKNLDSESLTILEDFMGDKKNNPFWKYAEQLRWNVNSNRNESFHNVLNIFREKRTYYKYQHANVELAFIDYNWQKLAHRKIKCHYTVDLKKFQQTHRRRKFRYKLEDKHYLYQNLLLFLMFKDTK